MSQQPSNKTEQPVQIKQRVIGAIVLVSLGVIFIPMLLNSERSLDDGMPVFGSNIPDKPDYIAKEPVKNVTQKSTAVIIKSQADFDSRVPVDEHTPPLKAAATEAASFAKIEAKTKKSANKTKLIQTQPKKIITAKVKPAAKQPAKAWAIQVGSFSDRKNAFKLRNKLRSKKFTTFVEAVKTPKGRVYRVRVGPEIKRSQAEKIQKRLKTELKISGLIVAHP